MRTRDLSLALLSTSCLLLTACGMTNTEEKLVLEKPVYYKNADNAIQSQVAQAVSLMKAEKYSEASSYINQALQAQPKSVVLHILNALTYEKLAADGDPTAKDLAVIGYKNALSIEPSLSFAMVQLGKMKYRDQKFEEAQEHFANALLMRPKDTEILQEFAAASYYAYDIKKAFGAIQKALRLKPEDPLIQRSAAMMYAAMGDFKNAEKHCKLFQEKVGQNPDVINVTNRFDEWKELYASGRFKRAAAQSSDEAGQTVDVPNAGALPGGMSSQDPQGQQVAALPPVEEEPMPQQIYLDAYIVEIHEDAGSSKGNNILANLAMTLNPGSYVKFNGNASGSGYLSGPTSSQGDTVQAGAATGSGLTINSSGNLSGTIGGGALQNTINNAGNFSGYVFTRGINWAGLTYALNIANASDSRIEIVSRPTMLTNVKQESRFFSGTELANVTQGTVGSSLSRYQIGTQLTVLPKTLYPFNLKIPY